jgi:hypothetical protein
MLAVVKATKKAMAQGTQRAFKVDKAPISGGMTMIRVVHQILASLKAPRPR